MSRGSLDNSDLMRISQEVPDLNDLRGTVNRLSPDFISTLFAPESKVPIASSCLHDAVDTLTEARYALHEVFAHQIWHLEKKEPLNEMAAAFFGRFYADNAALRLYSAGEHLANAIIMMLEINDRELDLYKKKRISQQSVVGHYLRDQKASHPITEAVTRLADLKEWRATMEYRNRWVHEQPPTVERLGIVYKRRKRWKPLPNGRYTLGIGGGDKPEYSVEDLVGFIKPAMFQFSDTLTSVIKFYVDLLKSKGMRFDKD